MRHLSRKTALLAVLVAMMASFSSRAEAATCDAAKSSTVEVQGSGSPVMMIPGLISGLEFGSTTLRS